MPRRSKDLNDSIEEHPIRVYGKTAVASFVAGALAVGYLYERFRMPHYESKLESALVRESELISKVERLERDSSVIRPEFEHASTAESTAANRAEVPGSHLLPISIELMPGITSTNAEASRAALRLKRQLRELTYLESGKSMSNAPSGTFLFSSAGLLRTEWVAVRSFPVANSVPQQPNRRYFEFHRTREGKDLLVGFASETDAVNVGSLNGRDLVKIVLFPEPNRSPMTMVSIPVDRIVTTEARWLMEGTPEEVSVIDLVVR